MFTESQVTEPSARRMPTTRPVWVRPVRTVMRVGRSSCPSGLPPSSMTVKTDVNPGLPISSAARTPRMRSAARFTLTMLSARS